MLKFEDANEDDVPPSRTIAASKNGMLEAIFRVSEDGYVPPGVNVRSAIDTTMFTGSFSAELESLLRQDPKVESIAVGQRLRQIG